MTLEAYLLIVYVPRAQATELKRALFDAGAGRIGNYDSCCWQVEGQGQFRPLPGANPTQGEIDKIEEVAETRLEMMVASADREPVDAALRRAHPYETPAYFWVPVANSLPA